MTKKRVLPYSKPDAVFLLRHGFADGVLEATKFQRFLNGIAAHLEGGAKFPPIPASRRIIGKYTALAITGKIEKLLASGKARNRNHAYEVLRKSDPSLDGLPKTGKKFFEKLKAQRQQ